jgi:hypothetical protein
VQHQFLVSGYAYCQACGIKLQAKSRTRSYRQDGSNKRLKLTYSCKYHDIGYKTGGAECCKTIVAAGLDAAVWAKVWAAIADDELFEMRVREKVDALRRLEADAQATTDRLQAALDDLAMERQRIITWARKGSITEEDMELQLGGLAVQGAAYNRELQEVRLLVGNRADQMLEMANRYRAVLRRGGDFLNAEAATPEQAAEQYRLRREIMDAIVTRVDVLPDKTPVVTFALDLGRAGEPAEATLAGAVILAPTG